jgi:pyruvate-ferredoxin/flavodoxin oxidoreductase
MGEWADEWSSRGRKNLWGTVPEVVEMQSEGGAAGAVHGALTTGALSSTFTASQGLLLMIPNMYKIAGELTPTVFHVSARALAAQGLSIFGDHADIYSCRQTGFAMLAASSVQEVMDMATIAHAATLESRIPFIHFFDGFRTSHEVQKIDEVGTDVVRAMIDDDLVFAHRQRALTPDRPTLRGTAQNPDVYFQGRETVNPFYNATPAIVQKQMDKFAALTGRSYKLFDYFGAPDAEHVIVVMGSGNETVREVVTKLNAGGAKLGVVVVRLFRPFDVFAFAKSVPECVKTITVLDRTKEPGSIGDPLYVDVRTAIGEAMQNRWWIHKGYPAILGGRYGLGSKEFTPAMVKGAFDNAAAAKPKNHFAVGIKDDVTGASVDYDPSFLIMHEGRKECVFYGLGSDGTVGANKNSIKIIGEDTPNNAQGYFVYDSKKAGAITVSHLRFGKDLIESPYLCTNADFVACHNFSFVEKYDMLANIRKGGVFLLASPYSAAEIWNHLPDEIEKQIIDKQLRFYIVDAIALAEKLGLGSRINTIMQTAFFKIAGILPEEEAIGYLKSAAKKAYGRKGDAIVQQNWNAIDAARDAVVAVKVPAAPAGKIKMPPPVALDSPQFVIDVTGKIMEQKGDSLPVSAMPCDGVWPTATSQYEKRNIATKIPAWDPDTCIQCTQCSLVCPHAAIRAKVYSPELLAKAPATFKSADAKGKEFAGKKFTIQVAPEDCVGCGACVHRCPAKNKADPTRKAINMADQIPLRAPEAENYKFFLDIPEVDPATLNLASIKGSQLCRPLFEYSGACAGCGETPYLKLLTQLFGDRMVVANATGCSSIYSGNLPTTPYAKRADGRGPAWSNSLFEDNAEFGLGMRLTADKFRVYALELVAKVSATEGCSAELKAVAAEVKDADQSTQQAIEAQRARVAKLKALAATCDCAECKRLVTVADYLVKKSVWIIGGDGWAYDIGYGGLDHVLASGRNVNVLVMDTEVYSNTGGQASKATPLGAVAKFASSGKPLGKKDLGMISMTYGGIYVAQVAMGANPVQTVKAFVEAEAYDGPSLIIAYSHCIAHGIEMITGMDNQKLAVETGHFPLYRFNPKLTAEGKNPLVLDSKAPTVNFSEQAKGENRFQQLVKLNPNAEAMFAAADLSYRAKYDLLTKLAALPTYQG